MASQMADRLIICIEKTYRYFQMQEICLHLEYEFTQGQYTLFQQELVQQQCRLGL